MTYDHVFETPASSQTKLLALRRLLRLRFLIGRHLLKASIASSRLLDECSYNEGDASYDEDGGEDGRECGHCLSASRLSALRCLAFWRYSLNTQILTISRKDKSQLGLQLPRLLAYGRPNRVIVGGDLKLHRQIGDPDQLAHAAADRNVHLLLVAIQLAVISGDEVSAQPSPK